MKKILVITLFLALSISIVNANEGVKQFNENQQTNMSIRHQREQAFEKRLGLTEAQKLKAKDIRKKGHEKIKPVIEQIRTKKQEAKMVTMSKIGVEAQKERLNNINAELKVLEKKAHDIRKKNMKEFEAILDKQQKAILKQMKREGRKKYQEEHPAKKNFLQNSFDKK